MDRAIQRTWLQKNGRWALISLAAITCTMALLCVSRDSPRVLNINEGRIVVSTVKQGQFDEFIPVRAGHTAVHALSECQGEWSH